MECRKLDLSYNIINFSTVPFLPHERGIDGESIRVHLVGVGIVFSFTVDGFILFSKLSIIESKSILGEERIPVNGLTGVGTCGFDLTVELPDNETDFV